MLVDPTSDYVKAMVNAMNRTMMTLSSRRWAATRAAPRAPLRCRPAEDRGKRYRPQQGEDHPGEDHLPAFRRWATRAPCPPGPSPASPGIGRDTTTRVGEDPGKGFNVRVYAKQAIGATRVEEEKVVQIDVQLDRPGGSHGYRPPTHTIKSSSFHEGRNRPRQGIHRRLLANGDSAASVLRFFSVMSGWRVGSVLASCSAITAADGLSTTFRPAMRALSLMPTSLPRRRTFRSPDSTNVLRIGPHHRGQAGMAASAWACRRIWRLVRRGRNPDRRPPPATWRLKGHFIDGN
ncbi:hypothetical protein SNK04_014162 [Fusarium graminearum]